MDLETVLESLLALLRDKYPDIDMAADTALDDGVAIDSLSRIELVMLLEDHFDLQLERADLDRLTTPAAMAQLIADRRSVA